MTDAKSFDPAVAAKEAEQNSLNKIRDHAKEIAKYAGFVWNIGDGQGGAVMYILAEELAAVGIEVDWMYGGRSGYRIVSGR